MRTNAGAPPWDPLGDPYVLTGSAWLRCAPSQQPDRVTRRSVVAPNDQRMNFMYANMTNRQLATHYYEIALEADPRSGTVAAALAHQRLIDHRYSEVVALLNPE